VASVPCEVAQKCSQCQSIKCTLNAVFDGIKVIFLLTTVQLEIYDIQVPIFLLTEAPGDHSTAKNCVNNYYLDIVNSLYNASIERIPRKKQGFFKYWWDQELT